MDRCNTLSCDPGVGYVKGEDEIPVSFFRRGAAFIAACVLAVGCGAVTAAHAAAATAPALPFGQCPAISAAPGCEILLVVSPDGSVSVQGDPSVGPYDGSDDTLVGIVNDSSTAVSAVTVSGPGSDLSGFDGDGICSGAFGAWTGSSGCPYGPTEYEGPGTSFVTDPALPDSAEVDFAGGLKPGGSAFFSLEGALTSAELTARQGPLSCDPVGGSGGAVPDYCIPQDWDVHTPADALVAGQEPLNVVLSARSTVPVTEILGAMKAWTQVPIGTLHTNPTGCMSAEFGDVTGTGAVPQSQSWRLSIGIGRHVANGCLGGNVLSFVGDENHARLWSRPISGSQVGGATFIAASFETTCVVFRDTDIVPLRQVYFTVTTPNLWHCVDGSEGSYGSDGYNTGAEAFVLDLEEAAHAHKWTVTTRLDPRAAGAGGTGANAGAGMGLGVGYDGLVEVVTVTG